MSLPNREIIKINPEQVTVIHKLAHRIWPTTFKNILTPEQIDYMLELMYSEESLKNQIKEGCDLYVLNQDKRPVGYLSLQHDTDNSQKTKIHKIYVLPETQGTGAGKNLMDFASAKAKAKGDKALFLNVNRYNSAIGFYEHYDFIKQYKEDIDIGQGYLMEDWVMQKSIL